MGDVDVTGDLDVTGTVATGVSPTTAVNGQADNLIASGSSHCGITINTNGTGSTENIFFQDANGLNGRIIVHGYTRIQQ